MGPVSVVRRWGRFALALLLVAVLGAVGVSAPLAAYGVSAVTGDTDAGVAVGSSRVDAMVPSRSTGRLIAEPSLVCVHAPGDGVPVGATPHGPTPVDLVRLGDHHATVTATSGTAGHGMAGMRAPPALRSVL